MLNNNIGLIKITDNFSTIGCTVEIMQKEIQKLTEAIATINNHIDELYGTGSDLRPVTDATADIPNQKCDLEIFNQIVPSEEFLKLADNMFLN